MNVTLNVIDLFSGCGGLSIGLQQAGLNIVAGIDSNSDAIETYCNGHSQSKGLCIDIKSLIKKPRSHKDLLNNIDVVVGGPPCQGFCAINPKRSIDDPRNSCVDLFIEVVKIVKPKFVLIENVTGLLGLGKGFALKTIIEFFSRNDYSCTTSVLQAANYGVPQIRWRLFIAASKKGEFKFPEPTHSGDYRANFPGGNKFLIKANSPLFHNYHPPVTIKDAIGDLPKIENGGGADEMKYSKNPQTRFQIELRKGSSVLYNHRSNNLGKIQLERVFALKKQGMNWLDLPENLIPENLKKLRKKYGDGLGCKSRFGRLSWDGQFTTILTKPEMYWGSFIHPEQDRVISVREAARAQTFPDHIRFCGAINSQYRQIGNAVPVLLAYNLGKAIINHFGKSSN